MVTTTRSRSSNGRSRFVPFVRWLTKTSTLASSPLTEIRAEPSTVADTTVSLARLVPTTPAMVSSYCSSISPVRSSRAAALSAVSVVWE